MRRARDIAIAALMLAFMLVFVWGCASTTIVQVGFDYIAFGDSITYGTGLQDPATQAYPVLVAADEQVAFRNFGVPGDQACDIAPHQVFLNAQNAVAKQQGTYSVLIGTNDVDSRGTGAYEAVFLQCHQAVLAWLAVAEESKVRAGRGGFSASGPGALDASSGWTAWTTQGQGSTASFALTTSRAGPIYAWIVIDDASAATYTYSLDGVLLGSGAALLPSHIATQNGTSRSLGFLRLANIPAGKHTLTFTQTNPGKDGVSVVAIGVPAPVQGTPLPTVLAGTVPFQQHTGADAGCQNSDEPCQVYNADIAAEVNMFVSDGLDVRIFDTRQYMHGTPSEMYDALHPNAQGQKELSEAVQAAWKTGQ